MDAVVIFLLGGFFILYHLFGQPRLLKEKGDVGVRTIYHFSGFLLTLGVSYFYIYLAHDLNSLGEVLDYSLAYLIFLTGGFLMLIDVIILIVRWANYSPEAPQVEYLPNNDIEIAQLEEQLQKLQVDSRILQNENDTYKETLASIKNRQGEYDLKLNNLRYKEDELDRSKQDWEKQKHADKFTSFETLKQKEAETEKRYADKLLEEKEHLQERYHLKITDFMDSVTDKLEKRIHSEKKNLMEDIFTFDGQTKDDFFELKRSKENLDKEKEAMERNKFLLEVDDKVSRSKVHVLEAKNSALDVKSENIELRSELKLMASEFKNELTIEKSSRERSVDTVLHKLELEEERRKSEVKDVGNKILLLSEHTKGQIMELANVVSNNLKDLEMKTMSSFREVRENISDMKLQFGQEVLRLDGQQGQILNELEKYYLKNQDFVHKCQTLALEAKGQNLEGHHLLNQVSSLYNQHKLEAKMMENNLHTALDQVSVKEGNLANIVGESMLKLKSVSEQQYIAMKDMALEKKDINLLWREKNQEHDMNLQEVKHQKQDLDRMKQFLDQEKSHFSNNKSSVMDNAKLTHQLYMNEQRYVEAIKKAESSNGFLTRIAKVAEYAMAKK